MRKIRFLALVSAILLIAVGLWAGGAKEAAPAASTTTTSAAVGPTNSNPLSDLRVRQAMVYAIDMKTACATLLQGMALPADSDIPNGPWKTPDLQKYEYNPEKAKALLKEANWDSNRVLDLIYYYADQETVDLMTAIQQWFAAVGIKIKFRQITGDLASQLNTLPADAEKGPSTIIWDLAYGAKAALALQEYYNAYARAVDGTPQIAHTPANATMDSLIAATNSTSDIAKQKEAFFALEKYMAANVQDLPLYYQQLFIYENKRLNRNGGLYGNDQYNYDWGITKWTVTPDASGKQILYTNTGPKQFFFEPWSDPAIHITRKVLWDRLITCDGSLTPTTGKLASSYKLSADGMNLSFTLRDGLKWHDGSPLTVDDVKWSVEFALKFPMLNSVFKKTFNSLKGAKDYLQGKAAGVAGITTSGNTITFDFATLDPNCLLTFTQWAPLPKKYLANADPLKFQQDPFWQNPIGSGPYKVDKVSMNDYLVMVPFKDYWGGVAKIDQIVCYPSDDNDANVVKNASAGKLDYGFTKNVGDVKSLQAMSFMNVKAVDIPYTRFLWINKFPKPAAK